MAEKRPNPIYTLADEVQSLSGDKLPSIKEALGLFLHFHQNLEQTVRQSLSNVINEIEKIWSKVEIPVRSKNKTVMKLNSLYQRWVNLKKNSNRKTETQKANELAFALEMDNLFDIASFNALETINSLAFRNFLIAQREAGRRGYLAEAVQQHIYEKEGNEKTVEEEDGLHLFSSQSASSIAQNSNTDSEFQIEDIQTDSMGTDSEELEMNNDAPGNNPECNEENKSSLSNPTPAKRAKIDVMTPCLAAALDRNKISDRAATYVLAAAAKSLGHDVKDLNINRSTIRRKRATLREEFAIHLKKTLQTSCSLIVHWDGKLLPDIDGKNKVDRLPVVVTGSHTEQLLGVPKIATGSGESQAQSVFEALQDWKLEDKVKGMCCDTTASNTGPYNGACVLLEKLLKRDLLLLACRHHVYELILRCVFETCLSRATKGPDEAIFKRFRDEWKNINVQNYETGLTIGTVNSAVSDVKDEVLEFVLNQLQNDQPRGDYREFLELICIFLGGTPPRGISFKQPGAVHHARWMAKAIYSLKMIIFKEQFALSAKDKRGLINVCIFIVRLYVRAWFTVTDAISAPYNDLNFLKNLIDYSKINNEVSKKATAKFASHLWYLNQEIVCLALFDKAVPLASKRNMIIKMASPQEERADIPKRVIVNPKDDLSVWSEREIEDFATPNTRSLLTSFNISTDFLNFDPSTWETREDFQSGREILKSISVVNDTAERGVALIEEFNPLITKDEEMKQYLLQIVQAHRKTLPTCRKQDLLNL